jgi:sporulation protein YlmC with PRC-barrel domain
MTKGSVEQTAITIRAIQIPILGWGIVMLTLLVLVWAGTLAHAEEQPVRVSNSSDMIGKLVKTPDGKNLGKIKDLVINWRRGGYIEYAVLSFGGFFGLGDEYVAVPWEALTLGDNKEHFVLNMKKEHLKNSPGFVVHHFYDRSSVAAQRGGRSIAAPSARVMKSDIGSDVNVSVARSFDMQYAMEAEFHR